MPWYDFRCKQCEHQFGVKVSVEERDGVRCPACDSDQLQRVYSPIMVIGGGKPAATGTRGGCSSGG